MRDIDIEVADLDGISPLIAQVKWLALVDNILIDRLIDEIFYICVSSRLAELLFVSLQVRVS